MMVRACALTCAAAFLMSAWAVRPCLATPEAEDIAANAGVSLPANAPRLVRVDSERSAGGWQVSATTTGPVALHGERLDDPPRYYVDLAGCTIDPSAPPASNLSVGSPAVRLGELPAATRLVIDLPSPAARVRLLSGSPTQELRILVTDPAPPTPADAVSRARSLMPSRMRRTLMASRGGVNRDPDRNPELMPDASGAPPDGEMSQDALVRAAANLPGALRSGLLTALSGNRRYVWGGEALNGFDCSGLTSFLYARAGVRLPHHAADQFHEGQPVPIQDLAPGDLVFFHMGGHIHHVGIFVGDGRFVHAANPRRGLTIDYLARPYYAHRFAGARRYLLQSAQAPTDNSGDG